VAVLKLRIQRPKSLKKNFQVRRRPSEQDGVRGASPSRKEKEKKDSDVGRGWRWLHGYEKKRKEKKRKEKKKKMKKKYKIKQIPSTAGSLLERPHRERCSWIWHCHPARWRGNETLNDQIFKHRPPLNQGKWFSTWNGLRMIPLGRSWSSWRADDGVGSPFLLFYSWCWLSSLLCWKSQ